MPDTGENEAADGKRFPSEFKNLCDQKTADGFSYLDPEQLHEYFKSS
jgi:hypothetical protein